MRIGAVARATGASQRLLRYYEEQGLLRPKRLPNGYGKADVAAVRNIRSLLAAGLPVRLIAEVLPCICEHSERIVPTCPEFIVNLRREQARISHAIAELKTSQRLLDEMLDAAPPEIVAAADRGKPEGRRERRLPVIQPHSRLSAQGDRAQSPLASASGTVCGARSGGQAQSGTLCQ